MKGWLVYNSFLKSAKFDELYALFQNSAQQLEISLQPVAASSLFCEATKGFVAKRPDFVLFWDKDISLAHRLEQAGFKLFNNARAVEICDSKVQTAMALAGVVPMPKTMFSPKTFEGVGYGEAQFVDVAIAELGLPLVIKEACGSFGQQVYLAQTADEAKAIVQRLAGTDFVLQQFVAQSFGRDVRLNVVGGKVVNAILRQSHTDFRSNITLGGSMSQYAPSQEQIAIAEKACQTIGLDFAGVDVLFGKDGPLLCEVNSNPHFKTTLLATGVDLSKNILQHILNRAK